MVDTVDNMQKLTTVAIASAIILATAFPTFAIDSTTSSTRKDKIQEKVDVRKERVAENIEARKEKIASTQATLRDKIASREAALKTKLAKFKDKQKAQKVETIDKTLTNINKNRTDQMIRFLDNASLILTKLETRVNQAATNGKDTAAATAAITEARGIISSASESVKAQAEKSYTISITSESKVSADAKVSRDSLHTDLKAVLEIVKSVKKAVGSAIEVSATTLGGAR